MPVQKSMKVTVPSSEVHRNFGALVRRVFSGKEHFVVERDGLPVVAIISMKEYEELMQERENKQQGRLQRLRKFQKSTREIGEEVAKSGLSEDELMASVEETRHMYQTLKELDGIGDMEATDASTTIDDVLYGEKGAWKGSNEKDSDID